MQESCDVFSFNVLNTAVAAVTSPSHLPVPSSAQYYAQFKLTLPLKLA